MCALKNSDNEEPNNNPKIQYAVYGFILGVMVTSAYVYFGSMALKSRGDGICKKYVAGAQAVAVSIEDYRKDHSVYPEGLTVEALQKSVEPKYIQSMPTTGIGYYSDGSTYILTMLDHPSCECFIEIKDGEIVTHPIKLKSRKE